MQPLRIALVHPTHHNIHSSLANVLKIYRHLIHHKQCEVTLFTDRKNRVRPSDYPDFKIEYVDRTFPPLISNIQFVLGLPRFGYRNLIEKLRGYDVIESSNPEFYLFAYQCYQAAQKYNAKLVYRTSQTVTGFFLFWLSRWFVIPWAKKAYSFATALLFTNPSAQHRALRLRLMSDLHRSTVIGHATDTKLFVPMAIREKKTVLLSVGGLYEIKGHHLIIQALRTVVDQKDKYAELWIVGEGYYRQKLEKVAEQLGLKNRVRFLGNKTQKELVSLYNKADVFVLANYQEITPAVNEALSCQTPVVVMECGGRSFVIPNAEYGLVSKRMDVQDMAQKIIFLLNHRDKAKKKAKKGCQRIKERFSVPMVAEKIYSSFR